MTEWCGGSTRNQPELSESPSYIKRGFPPKVALGSALVNSEAVLVSWSRFLGSHAVSVSVWISSKGFKFRSLLWGIVPENCTERNGLETEAQGGCVPDEQSPQQQTPLRSGTQFCAGRRGPRSHPALCMKASPA